MSSKQNINPEEVDKFNQMAADWWNPEGPMRPLHDLNPVRLNYIQNHAVLQGANVVDVGCGAGLLSEAMAKTGATVTGIDASTAALSAAKKHAENAALQITYTETTVETLAANAAGKYDIVTCMEMLEHVPNPQSVINACANLLKPTGIVFFSTINRTLQAFLKGIVAAEYVLRLLPRGTHHYAQLIQPAELEAWSRESGLQRIDLSGMTYNPFTRHCQLVQNPAVNYVCCYQKIGA